MALQRLAMTEPTPNVLFLDFRKIGDEIGLLKILTLRTSLGMTQHPLCWSSRELSLIR